MAVLAKFDLTGKVAFVTGAGQGLGQAMAIALAEAGAHVAVVDTNEATGTSTVERIKGTGGHAIFIRTDVRSVSELSQMVERVVQQFGKLDIAVVAAGVVGPLFVPATDIQPDQWRHTISVNLDGVFFTDQVAGRQMIKQERGGRIINIASMSATVANAGPTYGASKAGVVMITKALAVEWAKYGITVNSISPGTIETPMSQLFLRDPAVRADLEAKTPLGRIGLPEELAGLIVYLASDASSYFTGHDFIMDGGYTVV
jgi:NAD(P)-dependent dehydrogenase (short-subunit alcohol dehydrogenase family)